MHTLARTVPAFLIFVGCSSNTGFNSEQDVDPVLGDADFTFSPAEMIFTDCNPGMTYSQYLTFESTGSEELLIYGVRPTGDSQGAFSVSEESTIEVPTGGHYDALVLVVLTEDEPATAELRITTNVDDWLDFTIPLEAYPVGWTEKSSDTGSDTGTGGADTAAGGTDTSAAGDTASGGTGGGDSATGDSGA